MPRRNMKIGGRRPANGHPASSAIFTIKNTDSLTFYNFSFTVFVKQGLKGKALSLQHEDFPKANEIRRVIPADCFVPETSKSLGYLSVSLVGTAICTAVGIAALNIFNPANLLTLPFWAAYSTITGTVAMGLWVLAHEVGQIITKWSNDLVAGALFELG